MHVSSLSVDLNWLLQFVFTALVLALGLRHILKNTASKYFVVDANSDPTGSSSSCSSSSSSSGFSSSFSSSSSGNSLMPGVLVKGGCAVCGEPGTKQCSGCKAVKYCSQSCQSSHWREGHKNKCKTFGREKTCVPSGGSKQKQVDKILFPYDEFIKLFNWDKPGLRPCGLINCGNSCFANVVLQCLAHTRPLVAYLMDKDHRRECRRNGWCFLCELQCHLERASHQQPFSPLTILSRLPSIGGNLGYGKQEDAHEFMRFAIDTMQSVCLDEYGGEKLIHPKSQETTLIQHIFGGQLQSQVICTQCNQVSNQYENMMDLAVEIQGDAASLEECLDQFTVKEWLHGDNMYKCDGCSDYVKAWKRLTIRQAPNILTIALKRFQSGRFGKLNKKITFPENLILSPYMSEEGDHADKYKLYAVVVHVDMLNASYFGHYICYIKDFQGTWYMIDDCKVVTVELDEVLSQGAYMLLYSRISARAKCLKTFESPKKQEELEKSALEPEKRRCMTHSSSTDVEQTNCSTYSVSVADELSLCSNISVPIKDPTSSSVSGDAQDHKDDDVYALPTASPVQHTHIETTPFISSPSEVTKGLHVESICSQGNVPFSSSTSTDSLASDDTSDEMQQFRNRIQLLEPGLSSESNLPTSSLTESITIEEDESPLTLDAASEANANCNKFTFSDPNNDNRESERCQSNGNCNIFSGLDPPNKSAVARQTEYDLAIIDPIILNQVAPENDSRESERCLSDMNVDEVEINKSYSLPNGTHSPDQNKYASSINNGLDEPSSSHQELSLTFQEDLEIDDNEVNENASSNGDDRNHQSQGSLVNGGSFYAANKQLIGKTHNPGVMESGAAH